MRLLTTRTASPASLLLALLLPLASCTPRRPAPEELLRQRPPARVRPLSYHGWPGCRELSNGLVRAVAVPSVGGRTLEFALGRYNFLLVGRDELGTTPDLARRENYPLLGGQFARVHPEARWQKLQSRAPAALFLGPYQARPAADGGPHDRGVAAIELVSPADLATGTSLLRRIELFPTSTHLRITDTLTSVRYVPQEWGLHEFVHLKGHPRASGVLGRDEPAGGDLRLYVPLDPSSAFPEGFQRLLPSGDSRSAGARQWSHDLLPGLLVLRYGGAFSKVLVDPRLPWVAWVDHESDHAFIQVCSAPRKAILTAGGGLLDGPFVEVQCFGAAERLEPGQSVTLVQDWYATRCPGPIVDVTEAGAVSAPLSLLREKSGKTSLAGTFGLFHVGTAAIVFRDAQGATLHTVDCGVVSPLEPLVLHRPVELPAGTREVALEVRGPDGRDVGHLGRILLAAP